MKRGMFSSDGVNLLRAGLAVGFAITPFVVQEAWWFRDALANTLGQGVDWIVEAEILMFALIGGLAGLICRAWAWSVFALIYVAVIFGSGGMALIVVLHAGAYIGTAFTSSKMLTSYLSKVREPEHGG